MSNVASGPAVLAQVGRRLDLRISTAHISGALLAVGSGALTSANIRGQHGFGRIDLITLAIYLPLSVLLAGWVFSRRTRKVTTWIVEDRAPTTAEQRSALGLPLYLAAGSMLLWVGAAIIWTVLTIVTHHDGAYTVRVALSIVLGGLTACGLTYLLVEWTIRPITARALAGNVPECVIAPGVRTKLLLSWAVGADVFLLMIGLSFVGRPADEPPSAAAIWFIIVAGLVAGSLVVYVATRSLVNPLLELRQAVGKVQRGNLDVQLDVNDGGELGLLQAGVNQMVQGLRERRTLQDLFGRHVGEEVARQALEQGEVALGGERREVGVIFVDVIGSTRLAQSRPPEAVVDLLNQFFATVVEVVAAEGGWVNKFEGDGALCVFGAPVSQNDFARRALRAARVLRRELLSLAAANPELDAAIGVSAGSVVAGNIGDERRYEYTVIGTPVNEAARLTDEAKHRLGRVLASEEAVSRAGPEAESWLVSGELQLRGIGEPVLVYEPTGRAEVRQPAT
ncbi:MAG TPA: adenylate/guanylate cyclase domain-containing protein [Acidimicrobiales bacterium]|jgi:adenylate cyclase|nr:adenylate/guanylate cyclase domain-containing protein [Acidimicrobiales bacterium]